MESGGERYLGVDVRRRQARDLVWRLQAADGLGAWSDPDTAVEHARSPEAGGMETATLRSALADTSPVRFVRLVLTRDP